ncbi:MAG: hypothetical protein EXS63_07845 [Candidatus Omnitrophica bacterium]|nr:hypothetical protein [Candidatus Omnitrophota bacterium]
MMLYAAWRILCIYFFHPFYLYTYPIEEPYRGVLAVEWIRGLSLPIWDYAADTYSGGVFIIGSIASFFFRLLGPSAFALKLTSVFLFSIGLAFWHAWLKKYAGARTALYFALLFIFSSPALTRYSLITLGDHAESICFAGAGLYFLFRAMEREGGSKGFSSAIWAGLITGLGVWVTYLHGVAALAMIIFWMISGRRALKDRNFHAFIAALLLGFFPLWISFNRHIGFQGLMILQDPLWMYFHPKLFLHRMIHLHGNALVRLIGSFTLGDMSSFLPGRWVSFLYAGLYALPVGLYALGRRFDPSSSCVQRGQSPSVLKYTFLYLGLMLFITQASNFTSLRYLIPLQPFILILTAVSLSRMERIFPAIQKAVTLSFFFILLIFTALFHFPAMSLRYAGSALKTPGYDYTWISQAPACGDPRHCLETYKKLRGKISPQGLHELQTGIGYTTANFLTLDQLPEQIKEIEHYFDPEFEKAFFYFLGQKILFLEQERLEPSIERTKALMLSPSRTHFMIWGMLGGMGDLDRQGRVETWDSQKVEVPLEYQLFYWQALGKKWMRLELHEVSDFSGFEPHLRQTLDGMPPPYRDSFLRGCGMAYLQEWDAALPFKPNFLIRDMEKLPVSYQEKMFEGIGMAFQKGRFFDLGMKQDWRWERVLEQASEKNREAIFRGIHMARDYFEKEMGEEGEKAP